MAVIIVFVLFALSISPITIDSAHIGLFASTGCYSHDVLMRHFADRLASVEGGQHQVTLIQIRVYEFTRGSISGNGSANTLRQQVLFDAHCPESMETLGRVQRQMWTNIVPFDGNSHNADGMMGLMQLHNHQIEACYKALKDPTFMGNVKKLRLDLLVTDYVLNECALRFSTLLDVNMIYFSNYPVLSSYAVDLGISSNPSYVPSVFGYESTRMPFPRRVFNSLLYFFLWSSRQWIDFDANQKFKRALGQRFLKKSKKGQRSAVAFATPFEMIIDVPRPVARNLHYFGCDHCFDFEKKGQNAAELLNITISGDGIILVSFGTVTKGDQIPAIQLQRLIRTFAKFPSYTFIWQLDLERDRFVDRVLEPINLSMPSNVHLFTWIPLKQIMTDERVILSINHGGISTCSEAVHHGIPILGLALQGDQGYNLRRLLHKGVAEMLPISGLTDQAMHEKLAGMINHIGKYKLAARKLRAMVRDYKSLYKGATPSVFWVNWTARHFGHGRNASVAATKAKRFLTLRYPSNWFLYYSMDTFLLFSTGMVVIVWIVLSMRNVIVSLMANDKRLRFV